MNNYRDYFASIKEELSDVEAEDAIEKRKENVGKLVIVLSKSLITVNCVNFIVLAANNKLDLVSWLAMTSTIGINSGVVSLENKALDRIKAKRKSLNLKRKELTKKLPIDVDFDVD